MNSKVKLILAIFALLVLIGLSTVLYNSLSKDYSAINPPNTSNSQSTSQNASQSEVEAIPAPDFAFTDFDGNDVQFSDFVGKPIVINFWASWCPPCKKELPDFDKVAVEMGEDVIFIMLNSTDGARETVEIAKKYLSEQDYTFPVYFDTKNEGAYAYGVTSLPTTVFIDKDGNVVKGYMGMINEETLRKGIDLIK